MVKSCMKTVQITIYTFQQNNIHAEMILWYICVRAHVCTCVCVYERACGSSRSMSTKNTTRLDANDDEEVP